VRKRRERKTRDYINGSGGAGAGLRITCDRRKKKRTKKGRAYQDHRKNRQERRNEKMLLEKKGEQIESGKSQ